MMSPHKGKSGSVPTALLAVLDELSQELAPLSFGGPVTHVYNPLEYARDSMAMYLERFAPSTTEVLLLGMNPGPWGMAQTGVPFGHVALVRDWMGIEAEVGKPAQEHPKRVVEGFDCERREVSGQRLWGWVKERFGTPENFAPRFFIFSHCPLYFIEESGRNRTPDRLSAAERDALYPPCDRALAKMVEILEPKAIIGIGNYGLHCAKRALPDYAGKLGKILHPSPASPIANRGWAPQAEAQLEKLGIALP